MSPQVNGDSHASSATISHIRGYPVVNDVVSYYQKNPYGKKSLELGDSAYQIFARPLVLYLERPYELYLSAYVQKADRFGAGALVKIDEKIPIIKESTESIQAKSKQAAFYPIVKTKETADHLFGVYNSEVKKVGGHGVVTTGKALLSTGIVLTTEALEWVNEVLRSGKEKAEKVSNDIKQ
ncbi:hypothetical protein PFICI_09198 [Pestalotiopsis fici W106-1]|uniref:Pathogenesis associated protein Cap20 n=1 Tax=Pestalotiopsis fici (strain W106-1 / CGMCC3.15140) TaxID=1229662 RepID=W3WZS3_PESFW|nr:uncharacterized protein PFICI_09198 [Pestalotiopsis fici W106-1]ETS79345.1 hypothetical protein PFICI_09198 [Pestalotiopsis fici W106-1]